MLPRALHRLDVTPPTPGDGWTDESDYLSIISTHTYAIGFWFASTFGYSLLFASDPPRRLVDLTGRDFINTWTTTTTTGLASEGTHVAHLPPAVFAVTTTRISRTFVGRRLHSILIYNARAEVSRVIDDVSGSSWGVGLIIPPRDPIENGEARREFPRREPRVYENDIFLSSPVGEIYTWRPILITHTACINYIVLT